MKLERNKDIDYSSTMDLEGYDSEIDFKDLHKMFSMFQNPYKNNIGSIVREITSNCFDSHAEAGVNDAVIVKIDKDDSGWYISFIDVGVGLSPDRIKNIYVKYLSSTKEDSNDFIGAFGIGSKSPLSYQNMFFINTRYEGVEYQYMMRVGEIKPKIEKLDEFDTTERNGTEIKMYIKKGEVSDTNYRLGDLGKFVNECNKQLFYFDNVYFPD
jgi:DNA topoisomerase VI subunit B